MLAYKYAIITSFSSRLQNSLSIGLATSGLASSSLSIQSEFSKARIRSCHPLLKTFHLLLIHPKTFWWLVRCHVHRPLLTDDIVPLLCNPPTFPLSCNHSELSAIHESVMSPFITSLCTCAFPCQEHLNACSCLLPHIPPLFQFPWKVLLDHPSQS